MKDGARRSCPSLQHPHFRGVRLGESDAPAGLVLSTEAGWNQTEADWILLLRTGLGYGFEAADGTLVASGVLFPYGETFAWIGMVLVSAAARRQRLATLLMEEMLAESARRHWRPLLDATPEGRHVYLPLGFKDLQTITRWFAPAITTAPPQSSDLPASDLHAQGGEIGATAGSPAGTNKLRARPPATTTCSSATIRPIHSLARIAKWDAALFGAARDRLLEHLRASAPDLALQGRAGVGSDEVDGFALARLGRTATQIGPVVANDHEMARALLSAVLARVSGPTLIDVVDGHPDLADLLRARGFAPRRNFVRMIHGDAKSPGHPEKIWAITGPEFG